MSQFETHLIAEDPTVVLIANKSVLRAEIIKMLQSQHLQIAVVDVDQLLSGVQGLELFNNAYKVIWLHEYNEENEDEYLSLLSILKEVKIPVSIITTLITPIKKYSSNLLNKWRDRSDKQTQFIVDCGYYIPKANFVFGLEVITSGVKNTAAEFITKKISRGIVLDVKPDVSFLQTEDFIKNIKKFLFRPGRQASVLVRAKNQKTASFSDLIKKIYDSYHRTDLEKVSDSVDFEDPVPFSTEEFIVESSLKEIVTSIVKNLPAPTDEEEIKIDEPDEKLIKNEERVVSPTPDEKQEEVQAEKKVPKKIVSNFESLENIAGRDKDLREKAGDIENQFASESELDFDEENSQNNGEDKKTKEEEKLDVNSEIQRIFQDNRVEKKVNRIRKIAKDSKKITKKSKRRKFLFVGGLGITGAAIGVLVLAVVFFITQSMLKQELIKVVSGGSIEQEYTFAETEKLRKLTDLVEIQVDSYGSIIENNMIIEAASMVEISNNLQSVPQTLLEADEASKNLVLQVLTGNIGETSELAQILDDKVRFAYEMLSKIQASIDHVDVESSSNEKQQLIGEYEEKIQAIRSGMSIQQQLQPVLASLTGENRKKTYAVLLQNNQELRPTGGFIQAVALLNFDGGSLVSYNVYGVYDLDKKLTGDVVPPEDLKKYLGEEKWYLRDSNWNPDFPTTSKQVRWFINKILGIDIDGVIGMNLYTFQDILESTGPVELTEYNEIITNKNILERMEFHSEVILVDNSDTTDYSVVLFEKIIEKIATLDRQKVLPLVSSLRKSLDEGQLMISVEEESDQSVLHSLGWTGGLITPQCPTQLSIVDCQVDIMAQVESNIGVNKANYYIDRDISHSISVNKTVANHSRKITFVNNAQSNAWPKGTYKSYQRFYVDKNAEIEKVSINGSVLREEQINIQELQNFKEIGIRIDVPIQKQLVVEIDYSTPHSSNGGFSYVFFNQRQAGTSGDSLRVSIEHSSDLKPVLIAPAAEVYGNTITFIDEVNSSIFGVEFELNIGLN